MFTPKFFEFFNALAKNNSREWFNQHKSDYQQAVVQPMCAFIDAMAPRLRKISPHFIADSRPHGGSMFRIYRDVRFSKDKSPYKLHAACQFRHELGKDAHTVGGDGLKRSPCGFDADHEHIEDLKRKSFFLMRREPPEIILDNGFVGEVEKTFKAAMPLMEYIGFAPDIEI
jgi:uncharacterized protein (DUF2461 family)